MDNVKVFTPDNIVFMMLKYGHYEDDNGIILHKHVMDNSCGDGAILKIVVLTYIASFAKKYGGINDTNVNDLVRQLSTYIHGIEIEEDLSLQCKNNLNKLVHSFGLPDIDWDITCADALLCDKYNGKMDYVFGNPPYKNVHNFGENKDLYKSFTFIDKGMADLYIVFFEVGFNMLNDKGVMVYITPSSWTTSMAGENLREYIINNNLLNAVIDFKSDKVFEGATTFTLISCFSKKRGEKNVIVYHGNAKENKVNGWCIRPLEKWVIDGKFYFNFDLTHGDILQKVTSSKFKRYVKVKNGFATLKDKLFVIEDLNKSNGLAVKDDNIINVVKASKNQGKYIIYPYDINGNLIEFENLSKHTQVYLNNRWEELSYGEKSDKWWSYGRTQAINDVNKLKISFNNLFSDKNDIKYKFVKPNEGVYSGYYITADNEKYLHILMMHLPIMGDEFIAYVKSLGKYKNGGYYTLSSKETENYLNYKIEQLYETKAISDF